jgi:hypothetical protein
MQISPSGGSVLSANQHPYFAKVLEVGSVPITLETDGTFQFFGSGRKVYEYKTPYDDIQGSEI